MARHGIAVIAILAMLAIPSVAFAGGWAIASFDEVPAEFQAGSSYDLEYTVLQHGQTPVDVGSSEVRLIDSSGAITTFGAVATGDPGRYAVTITFPASGTWQWEVTQGNFPSQEMGTIEVTPAPAAVASSTSVLRWLLPITLVLVIGLIAVQVASVAKARRSSQPIRAD